MGVKAEYLETAREAAGSAGRLVMEKFRKSKEIKVKSPKDFVTEMDIRSEKLIISRIKEKHPDHSFLGEESGKTGDVSEYTWVIDPIDGTNNFAFGLRMFGVSIGLLEKGKPVLGVIDMPALDERFHAVSGGGAFLNGKRIRVSGRNDPGRMLAFYHANMEKEDSELIKNAFETFSNSFFSLRMMGAATYHLTRIAMGVADAWFEQDALPWDITAGALILEEAGGKATDFGGKPWNPWSKNLVATNGKVHGKVLEIAGSVWE